jgi:hypothetical protein
MDDELLKTQFEKKNRFIVAWFFRLTQIKTNYVKFNQCRYKFSIWNKGWLLFSQNSLSWGARVISSRVQQVPMGSTLLGHLTVIESLAGKAASWWNISVRNVHGATSNLIRLKHWRSLLAKTIERIVYYDLWKKHCRYCGVVPWFIRKCKLSIMDSLHLRIWWGGFSPKWLFTEAAIHWISPKGWLFTECPLGVVIHRMSGVIFPLFYGTFGESPPQWQFTECP